MMDYITRSTKKYQVTLPAVVRQALELRPGDHIAFVVRGEIVTIANARTGTSQDEGVPTPTTRANGWDTPEDDEAFKAL
jgi:AbrB family looped-hinge helix DNA binding protein